MKIRGICLKYGDDINTDIIIPGRYLSLQDSVELANHVFEPLDADFRSKANGSILIVGKNFGCGSSREQAVLALKHAGVQAIIASSFARIFFRNAINLGLFVVESPGIATGIDTGDDIIIDIKNGSIINSTKNKTYHFDIKYDIINQIVVAGGLIAWLKQQKHTRQ